ncbi:16537_t:CDS:2, partial [Racocetra persica]
IMDVPSGKARCCVPSRSSIITSSTIFTSPTVMETVPVSSSNPRSHTDLLSNPSSPTDLSITSSPFPSSISTLASIIPKTTTTISTYPTGIASSANKSTITNENLPIIISITIFGTLLMGALLFAYIRSRHKRQRQNALATAIIAAEAGLDDNCIRSIVVNDDDVDTDHVINVVSISEGANLEKSMDTLFKPCLKNNEQSLIFLV